MRILTILGARPQFIKSKMLSLAFLDSGIDETILHTNQHYDYELSGIFFKELKLKTPEIILKTPQNLNYLARLNFMTREIKNHLESRQYDFVLVYGDTDSTLAGAFGANLSKTRLIHIEAGLRSFNNDMKEERNRVLSDKLSNVLFTPTLNATKNLILESKTFNDQKFIIKSGDIMLDLAIHSVNSLTCPEALKNVKNFYLASIHRSENLNKIHLDEICSALNELDCVVIFPLHPHTKKFINTLAYKNIKFVAPFSYLEMGYALKHCKAVISDSGGLQKEAFFYKKINFVIRSQTEWIELLESKTSFLLKANKQSILDSVNNLENLAKNADFEKSIFGKGDCRFKIIKALKEVF